MAKKFSPRRHEEHEVYVPLVPMQCVTAIKLRDTLVPKLPLGNPVSKAPALRAGKLELPVLNPQAVAWELAQRLTDEDRAIVIENGRDWGATPVQLGEQSAS